MLLPQWEWKNIQIGITCGLAAYEGLVVYCSLHLYTNYSYAFAQDIHNSAVQNLTIRVPLV
jgi:hypothetical protein